MSAEQRRQHSFFTTPHFELGQTYQKDKEPSKESPSAAEDIRQFDLFFSFKGLPDLIRQFGYEKGLFQTTLGVILNIWSLRQEMLGDIDTRELITLVAKDANGSLQFKNDLYGQSKDLEAMFEDGIHYVPFHLQQRYRREAKQAITTFQTLTKSLGEIDFSLPSNILRDQLFLLGFHEEEIDITPSLVANTESLRSQITSIDDVENLIQKKSKLKVLVGPTQCVTASPSHWSHHLGETIFVWASECVVNPLTKEIFIRQNGKFGLGEDKNVLPYLEYGQEKKQIFSSEEELMQFMNCLLETQYQQPKVLLDFLVQQFGGIRKAGKIDKNIKGGNFNSKPYFEAVYTLFQFEFDRMNKGQNIGVQDRLGNFSEMMKHQIARNQSKALPGLVEKYTDAVLSQPSISGATFEKLMGSTALQLDSGFKISIDMSLLDCVAGTPFSLTQQGMSLESLSATFGADNINLLKTLDSRSTGISSKEELERFCKAFGKDASLFSKHGTCVMCGKETYIWPSENGGCNVCPVCEVKDDLGRTGQSLEDLGNDSPQLGNSQNQYSASKETMGVSQFVSGIATPGLWKDLLPLAA